jgi:DNA repair protein RecN (Recombination protein N)
MDSKLSGVLDMLEEAAIQISKPATNCATTVSVWISTRTVCLSWSSASPVRFHWRVSITSRRKSCRFISLCWKNSSSLTIRPTRWKPSLAVNLHHQQALATAKQLHEIRQHYAQELSQHITDSMHTLAMPHGVFTIDVRFEENHLTAEGADRIEFRVTTNPAAAAGHLQSGLRR